jgi:hypothetical protein
MAEEMMKTIKLPLLLEWLKLTPEEASRAVVPIHYAIGQNPHAPSVTPSEEFFKFRECFYVFDVPVLGKVSYDQYSLYSQQSSMCDVPLHAHDFPMTSDPTVPWTAGLSSAVRALTFANHLEVLGKIPQKILLLASYPVLVEKPDGDKVWRSHVGMAVRCTC